MRRVRTRRSMQAIVAATAVVFVAAGVVYAARTVSDPPPKPPANEDVVPGPEGRGLYLLDWLNSGAPTQVVSIDAQTEKPLQLFASEGANPQMALAPDGSRLYVVSSLQPEGIDSYKNVIDTFDTTTGRRVTRAPLPELDGINKDRTISKLPPYTSDFVPSLDGSRIYLGESTIRRGPTPRKWLVGTFDTASNELLANSIELPDCMNRVFLPGAEPDVLTVVCSNLTANSAASTTNFVYFLRVADDGSAADVERVDLPDVGAGPNLVAGAASTFDGQTVYAVTRFAHVYVLDVGSRSLVDEADLRIPGQRTVQMGKVLLATSGRELYVGTGGGSDLVEADGITSFVTGNWVPIGSSSEIKRPYWSLALGPGEDYIYAPTFGEPAWRIQKFDARTFQQRPGIRGAAQAPTIVQVPRLGL